MSSLEEHDAEQAEITAMCEAGECDHPECHEQDFETLIAVTVSAYAHVTVPALNRDAALEKVRADAERRGRPSGDEPNVFDDITDAEWSSECEHRVVHITAEGEETEHMCLELTGDLRDHVIDKEVLTKRIAEHDKLREQVTPCSK